MMAKAHKQDIQQTQNGILDHTLGSWKDFSAFIADINLSWPTLVYRGQANAEWKVEPTLDRLEKKFPIKPNLGGGIPDHFDHPPVFRELQLRRFKDMARGKLANPPDQDAEDEWWALAQHHGLATPMLDWTFSPFVALFFAFDSKKCHSDGEYKEPKARAVFALAHHLVGGKGNKRDAPKPFSPKGYANYRLINQGGLFLRMPEPKDDANGGTPQLKHIDLESYVSESFPDDSYRTPTSGDRGNLRPRAILQKFTIPNEGRVECLRFLDHMNINRASLFPDLDGAAQYVNDLWEVNADKAIGYINSD